MNHKSDLSSCTLANMYEAGPDEFEQDADLSQLRCWEERMSLPAQTRISNAKFSRKDAERSDFCH